MIETCWEIVSNLLLSSFFPLKLRRKFVSNVDYFLEILSMQTCS